MVIYTINYVYYITEYLIWKIWFKNGIYCILNWIDINFHIQVEDTYRKIYISKGLTVTIHIKLTHGGQLEVEQLIETIIVKLGADKTYMSDD